MYAKHRIIAGIQSCSVREHVGPDLNKPCLLSWPPRKTFVPANIDQGFSSNENSSLKKWSIIKLGVRIVFLLLQCPVETVSEMEVNTVPVSVSR